MSITLLSLPSPPLAFSLSASSLCLTVATPGNALEPRQNAEESQKTDKGQFLLPGQSLRSLSVSLSSLPVMLMSVCVGIMVCACR